MRHHWTQLRTGSCAVLVIAALFALSSEANATPIRFDFGDGTAAEVLSGWTAATIAGGNDGTVSFTVAGVGVGLDTRDRETSGTSTQGADNDDAQVPIGTYGDMYRDIIYANNADSIGEGMDMSFIGLATNATYDVTVWNYDSGNFVQATSATWGQSGGSTVTSSFIGDQSGAAPGPDPNTNALTDYSTSFQITTDGAGAATIESRWVAGIIATTINGIEFNVVPPPLPEPSTLVLAAIGLVGLVAGRRRRQR